MLTIHDQIRELRAELASCALTRRERAQARAELDRLLARQARMDRATDALLFIKEAPPA
ncbi:hypothetical protein [Azospirillum argentinense]|uniref:hypothetical protein n=1 Tax=Azospirillum argentinense TaxID=2970906 RepID=UPI00190938DC|nr:hypothetical protein [Azospirillum argentinense]